MHEAKNIVGVIAVLLTFSGYIPYIRDIMNGKTKPHIFSWFLWGFVTTIVFILQIYGHAGIGAFVTLAAAIMCFVVIILGFKYKSTSDITKTDIFIYSRGFPSTWNLVIYQTICSTCYFSNSY